MPNMHIWCPIYFGHKVVDNANCADNAFYAGALQCHLCRQCQLCAWDTVFLKLNFHPVNFHFMHIWHCLWHFLGLKYACTSAGFGVDCCQTVPRPLYLYLYMTCICIWGDPCQGVPHTLGLFVRVGCHKGAATTEEAENLSFNPSFIVFKCLDSHHSFIGLFVGAVKCVTCFSCPQSPSHWLLNCAHTRSQSRCKHFPLYSLLKLAQIQNEAGKI